MQIPTSAQRDAALCSACRQFSFDPAKATKFQEPPRPDIKDYRVIPFRYQVSDDFPRLSKLRASIKNGCEMCRLLKDVIWSHIRTSPELRALGNKAIQKERQDPGCQNLEVQIELLECHPHVGRLNLGMGSEEWTPAYIEGRIAIGDIESDLRIETRDESFGFRQAFPGPDPLADDLMQLIQGWLTTCTDAKSTSHVWCPKNEKSPAPLRLLDVMQGETVRLVDTEGSHVKYAILSYCWGPSPAVLDSRTINENIRERKSGFPLKSLPQTLQDSVTLARRLGISYIWIDALCINQNSGEWMSESKRMMEYYENSYLTIIPVICSSADQGFLQPRPWWVERRINWPNRDVRMQLYYPQHQLVDVEVDASVWHSRGWTFQERLLSARSLFIGRGGMMFECRGGYARDVTGPDFRPSPAISNFLPILPKHVSTSQEWNNVEMARSKWYQLVQQYAGRKLTYDSDKLLALSGVASKFNQILGHADKYLDGLWESDLWNGLLWRLSPAAARQPGPITKSKHFPSWSWCCMNKPLSWSDGAGSIPSAQLVEFIEPTKNSAQEPDTPLAQLAIRAWTFPLKELAGEPPDGLEFSTSFDDGTDLEDSPESASGLTAMVLTAYLDGQDEAAWKARPANAPHDVSGIILRPIETKSGILTTYHRHGTFEILREVESHAVKNSDGEYDFDQVPVPIEDYDNSSASRLLRRVYQEKHMITLV